MTHIWWLELEPACAEVFTGIQGGTLINEAEFFWGLLWYPNDLVAKVIIHLTWLDYRQIELDEN